jgi:Barrel-sandwich domain of CusB or HlyD membrane-fusion
MANPLFRKQALEHAAGTHEQADILRLSPAWTNWGYWLIVSGAALAIAYFALAHVDEWAQGPALIRVEGTLEMTASASGTVAQVHAEPGQRVVAGSELITLTAYKERAELARLESEFDLQLARSLRDPADQAARQSLVTLRVERDLARARLRDLSVRAPRSGIVEDIRVRVGQAIAPGDQLLTLSGEDQTCTIWALLPGRYRPELKPGAAVRFNIHGYRYAQASTQLSTVDAQVLGPREVTRYLGNEVAGALELQGPTVIAKAELPDCTFQSDHEQYRFHQGMGGTSEVQVRTDALWAVLFPDLRRVFRWMQ